MAIPCCKHFRFFWGPSGIQYGIPIFGILYLSIHNLNPAAPSSQSVSQFVNQPVRLSDSQTLPRHSSLNHSPPPFSPILIVKIIIPHPQPNLDP